MAASQAAGFLPRLLIKPAAACMRSGVAPISSTWANAPTGALSGRSRKLSDSPAAIGATGQVKGPRIGRPALDSRCHTNCPPRSMRSSCSGSTTTNWGSGTGTTPRASPRSIASTRGATTHTATGRSDRWTAAKAGSGRHGASSSRASSSGRGSTGKAHHPQVSPAKTCAIQDCPIQICAMQPCAMQICTI